MNKSIRLKELVPEYYNDILDMEILISAEQFVIDKLADQMALSQNNLFVMLADERGLSTWEESLGISASSEIEDRRLTIIQRLLPDKPITLRYLKELLSMLNIDVSLSIVGFHVDVKTKTTDHHALERLSNILRRYLPANLTYTALNVGSTSTPSKLLIGTSNAVGHSLINKGGI